MRAYSNTIGEVVEKLKISIAYVSTKLLEKINAFFSCINP